MEEKTPSCKNCEEKSTCVPFFLHENMVMHMSRDGYSREGYDPYPDGYRR